MPLDPVQLLCDLVAIPSVNPMGRPVSGPEYLETRLTDFLETYFRSLGLPTERQAVEPRRDNLLCRIEGRGDRLLLLEAHQDTVPVDGMVIPPFTPMVRDGRIYGRGACDVKGGMAAMIAAVARLAEEPPGSRPTVVLACTINEECGFSGAERLVESWRGGGSPLLHRAPDAAIVAEPTQLDVVVAHKGGLRWRCHAHGVAAHSSRPELGVNAIYAASRVALAVERYQQEVLPRVPKHPLCGRPTACATLIGGGASPNTVPDDVWLEIERRLLPNEDPEALYAEMTAYLAAQTPGDQLEHLPPHGAYFGLSDTHNGEFAASLAATAREIEPSCKTVGVSYGTDASTIAPAGVPTVVFGPGSIDQAHTVDEWLAIEQLERAIEILYRFCVRGWN